LKAHAVRGHGIEVRLLPAYIRAYVKRRQVVVEAEIGAAPFLARHAHQIGLPHWRGP